MKPTFDRKTACNTGFASGGLTCKVGAMCIYSSSALVDSFVLRNPPERKARKRYRILYDNLCVERTNGRKWNI